jgi:hypothetical protein
MSRFLANLLLALLLSLACLLYSVICGKLLEFEPDWMLGRLHNFLAEKFDNSKYLIKSVALKRCELLDIDRSKDNSRKLT